MLKILKENDLLQNKTSNDGQVLHRTCLTVLGMQEEVNGEHGGGTGRLITDTGLYMTANKSEVEKSITEKIKM